MKKSQSKKSAFSIEIEKDRVRVKGSNFYKKILSKNKSPKLAKELKELGFKEGLNPISDKEFLEVTKKITSNRKYVLKEISKGIKKGISEFDGLRTTVKDRRFILSKLKEKGLVEDNISLTKKERIAKTILVKEKDKKEKKADIIEDVVW